jgi:hypothetical protein
VGLLDNSFLSPEACTGAIPKTTHGLREYYDSVGQYGRVLAMEPV